MKQKGLTSKQLENYWNSVGYIYTDLPERKCSSNAISQFTKIINSLKPKRSLNFLEIACGSGILADFIVRTHLEQFEELTFLDLSDFMVEKTKKRLGKNLENPKIAVKKENCEKLTHLEKDHYDVVVGNLVIHLVEKPEELLKCARRYLKTDGVLFLSILGGLKDCTFMKLAKDVLKGYFKPNPRKRSYFYFSEEALMAKLAEKFGFEVVESSVVSVDYYENDEQILGLYDEFFLFEGFLEKLGKKKYDRLIDDVRREIEVYKDNGTMIGLKIENYVLKKADSKFCEIW